MKRYGLVIAFTLFLGSVHAQQSVEVGYNLGLSSYLGDLKPQFFTLNQNSLFTGIQCRYNLNSLLAARLSFNYCSVKAMDSKSNEPSLNERNLSFKSGILEISAMGELNLLHFGSHKENKDDRKYRKIVPYLFGGVALFSFNPKAQYKGAWYELQPLGTEGQNVPGSNVATYNLTQLSIPAGLGVKYEIKPELVLSYEIGWRKTFTDYLDDVSGAYYNLNDIKQHSGDIAAKLAFRSDELTTYNGLGPNQGDVRGNPENKDWYIITNFTLSYKLFKDKKTGRFVKKFY